MEQTGDKYVYTFQDRLHHMGFAGWFIIFLISSGVIAVERLTPVYINNFYVRLFFYVASSSLLVFWVAWILFGFKAVKARLLIFLCVLAICFAKAFLTWGGDWKTDNIFYQSKSNRHCTIESQLRADRFAFGYKERVVERTSIVPFFDCISDVDTTKIDHTKWERINQK